MLRGRCGVVTGSLDGIGFAIASALAAQGCAIMLNDFCNEGMVEERLRSLRALGAPAAYCSADVSKQQEVERLIKATEQEFGPPDIVVNNAVTRTYNYIEDLPVDRWEYALAVNLTAPYHMIRLTIPSMKKRKWGRILNIASNYGLSGTARRADYCSTKHGLIGLTRVVALESVEHGITCNAICPGATYTPHARKLIAERMEQMGVPEEEAIKSYLAGRQPSRRFIESSKVADLAVFLCSESASEITGTPIAMDGGWLAFG